MHGFEKDPQAAAMDTILIFPPNNAPPTAPVDCSGGLLPKDRSDRMVSFGVSFAGFGHRVGGRRHREILGMLSPSAVPYPPDCAPDRFADFACHFQQAADTETVWNI